MINLFLNQMIWIIQMSLILTVVQFIFGYPDYPNSKGIPILVTLPREIHCLKCFKIKMYIDDHNVYIYVDEVKVYSIYFLNQTS